MRKVPTISAHKLWRIIIFNIWSLHFIFLNIFIIISTKKNIYEIPKKKISFLISFILKKMSEEPLRDTFDGYLMFDFNKIQGLMA